MLLLLLYRPICSHQLKLFWSCLYIKRLQQGTVIGMKQPPPIEGARSALFSNLSKSALDNYVLKRSSRHLWGGFVIPITAPYWRLLSFMRKNDPSRFSPQCYTVQNKLSLCYWKCLKVSKIQYSAPICNFNGVNLATQYKIYNLATQSENMLHSSSIFAGLQDQSLISAYSEL